jgi:hypothetical protein
MGLAKKRSINHIHFTKLRSEWKKNKKNSNNNNYSGMYYIVFQLLPIDDIQKIIKMVREGGKKKPELQMVIEENHDP